MRFCSTGNRKETTGAMGALQSPIPEQGHLWVPINLTGIQWPHPDGSAGTFISAVVRHFFDVHIDPAVFQSIDLKRHEGGRIHALNLHRGPTKSFKDVGCTAAAHIQPKGKVVVATSGDTGSAAAHAFGSRALVLYPAGRISAYQEMQMLSSEAVACAVDGDFDDCQRIAKQMIHRGGVGSCNSISLARLLPQIGYFAWAAFQCPRATFIVPSGNLGNATACVMARMMGAPVGDVVVACNENGYALYEHVVGGCEYAPSKTVATSSSAMDVGSPSNLVRLWHLGMNGVHVRVVPSGEVTQTDRLAGEKVCPHTAVGLTVAEKWPGNIVVVRTADAVKFEGDRRASNPYLVSQDLQPLSSEKKSLIHRRLESWGSQ